MGSTPSVHLDVSNQNNQSYFSIQLGHSDRLRLILAPENVISITKSVLELYWPIQNIQSSSGFVEIKLTGTPWYQIGETDLSVKYFICALLKEYLNVGWHLKASSDLQRTSESCVLFFERKEPVSTYVMCLSLNGTDKIRVLAPQEVFNLIRTALQNSWPLGIQREAPFGQGFEFKLKGNPWSDTEYDGQEAFLKPVMISELLSALFANGWLFIGAIDSEKRTHSLNALYFRFLPQEISEHDKFYSKFFSISLNKSDRIRLHRASPDLVSTFIGLMPTLWPQGIQNQSSIYNAYEFKLKGNPWVANDMETVESRRLLNDIFRYLASNGVALYATCELTKHLGNKTTFFFRTKSDSTKPLNQFCLSLNESDKLRMIRGDPNIANAIRQGIMSAWPSGIQLESNYYDALQFKLNGYPFQTNSGTNQVHACVMILKILENLKNNGFTILCSADVSGKYHSDKNSCYSIDLHSFFFEKNN